MLGHSRVGRDNYDVKWDVQNGILNLGTNVQIIEFGNNPPPQKYNITGNDF